MGFERITPGRNVDWLSHSIYKGLFFTFTLYKSIYFAL